MAPSSTWTPTRSWRRSLARSAGGARRQSCRRWAPPWPPGARAGIPPLEQLLHSPTCVAEGLLPQHALCGNHHTTTFSYRPQQQAAQRTRPSHHSLRIGVRQCGRVSAFLTSRPDARGRQGRLHLQEGLHRLPRMCRNIGARIALHSHTSLASGWYCHIACIVCCAPFHWNDMRTAASQHSRSGAKTSLESTTATIQL
jgi:hypothetical protein